MKKIPCVFVCEGGRATRTVNPGCEWVLAGEGRATRKWDGTACMVRDGKLYARFDAKLDKNGNRKAPPPGAIPCQDPDPITGHWPHWVLVEDQPHYKWHRDAWNAAHEFDELLADGTYELCGPAIGANAERLTSHALIPHGHCGVCVDPTFDGMRGLLSVLEIEGIVFHHSDGRMAKITRRHLGLPWNEKVRS